MKTFKEIVEATTPKTSAQSMEQAIDNAVKTIKSDMKTNGHSADEALKKYFANSTFGPKSKEEVTKRVKG